MTLADGRLRQRRHVLFTMLTACAWRDVPAGPAPVVAGLRTFLGGWLGIGRIGAVDRGAAGGVGGLAKVGSGAEAA